MKIFINYSDNMIPLEINKNTTIGAIKDKLHYIINLDPESQFLLFKGSVLKNYNSLSRYNIHEGNVLTLITFLEESKTIEIIIKTLTGNTVPLKVQPSDKVVDVKFKLQEIMPRLYPDLQRYIYEGYQLEDTRTLANYKIKDKDVIHLVLRLRGGKNILA